MEIMVNGTLYYIEFEKENFLFADIYTGRIYDVNEKLTGVIMVDESELILRRFKNKALQEYIENIKQAIINFVKE